MSDDVNAFPICGEAVHNIKNGDAPLLQQSSYMQGVFPAEESELAVWGQVMLQVMN